MTEADLVKDYQEKSRLLRKMINKKKGSRNQQITQKEIRDRIRADQPSFIRLIPKPVVRMVTEMSTQTNMMDSSISACFYIQDNFKQCLLKSAITSSHEFPMSNFDWRLVSLFCV